jgi:hypothetical protein
MSFTSTQDRHDVRHAQALVTRHEEEASATPPAHELKYRQDVARYVAVMLTELRQIAGKAGFDRLVTAVDAAYYEAYAAQDTQQNSNGQPHNGGGREKLSNGMEQSHA